uniref:cytochrome c oxidase subunit 3 n=1 Tax=Bostrychia tenuissima TaxID=196631 RepID=UPI002E7945AD|nr:cytochrome c oxidase subunit 3 [Bostrychia tenuissima]WQF69434.1 cytochrome c oxidase subunit 3 [Bostrychia tenuissima]
MNKVMKNFHQKHPFHLVDPSPWPFIASLAVFSCAISSVLYFHVFFYGRNTLMVSLCFMFFVMFMWWRDVVRESTFEGHHTGLVQRGLRYGVLTFMVSEITFFFAFFFAFFYNSLSPSIEVGSVWPPKGIYTMNPWQMPLLNTLILLLSGCTATWCHHATVSNLRKQAIIGMACTMILAILFTLLQSYEYKICDFRLSDGMYGCMFYMSTGFHGFHVIVGTMSLFVCLVRLMTLQLTQQHHFGFESSIWYWHFVDVVWLFLFVSIYWWGGV